MPVKKQRRKKEPVKKQKRKSGRNVTKRRNAATREESETDDNEPCNPNTIRGIPFDISFKRMVLVMCIIYVMLKCKKNHL